MRGIRVAWQAALLAAVCAGGCAPDHDRVSASGYREAEARIDSPARDGVVAGTLTWPDRGCPCPAAVLVPGAGSHDRDYTLFGHKPFQLLAHHLASHGIATLRFDEPGVGGSGGVPGEATPPELAEDVLAWIQLLGDRPEVDPGGIGIVGHSEGGTVGSLAAASSSSVAFLVMLGTPGLAGMDYNLQYERSMGRATGLQEEAIREREAFQRRVLAVVAEETDRVRAEERLRALFRELSPPVPGEEMGRGIRRLLSPGFRFNLLHDPARTLARVKVPVLAVLGEKDAHVPPEGNREALASALETGSGRDRIVVLPGVNHFFQTSPTGSPEEYPTIQETLSPAALDLILQWILTHTGRKAGSGSDSREDLPEGG